VPWLLVCLAFALYFGLFGWLAAKCWRLNWLWAIPLCWAAVEIFRSKIPSLYFPWSLSAASLFELPAFIQSAHFLGAFFVGAWISAFSVVAVMVMYRDEFKPRRLWAFAGTCIGVLAASVGYYAIPPEGETYTYGAVQPGVDLAFTPVNMQTAKLAENIPAALADIGVRSYDLLVLPEGIATWSLGAEAPDAVFPAEDFAPLVMGGKRGAAGGSYQSAFAFDGEKWSYADKTRLVIFGEYVPFRDRLPFLAAFDVPSGDLVPGEAIGTLSVGRIRAAPVLCFEALFEEVSRVSAQRGADVIAISSIDDWYQGTGAIDALLAGAVLRAIENGLPAVRSASLGPSAIIDARGNLIAYAEEGETTTILAEAAARGNDTAAPRLFFMAFACAVAIVVLLRKPPEGDSDSHTA
jgi:apolipoprotein N-acyltransferase